MVRLLTLPFLVVPDASGDPLAEFSYYPADDIMYVRWFGHLTAEEVIRVSKADMAQRTTLPYRRVLNDKSQTTGDWQEALPWLQYEWLPDAARSGVEAMSYVVSADVAQQLASRQFVAQVRHLLAVEMFHDLTEAHRWLLTK